MTLSVKCIVRGCTNLTSGRAVRNISICLPCIKMLTSGKPEPCGATFIHAMRDRHEWLVDSIRKLVNP